MSKGISWRQQTMLESIARHTQQTELVWDADNNCAQQPVIEPVAWRSIDNGPSHVEGTSDYFTPRAQWNHEQTVRRALRSLERRGLVELGQYVFMHYPEMVREWTCIDPDEHSPSRGTSRIMTGALLTEAGWAMVKRHPRPGADAAPQLPPADETMSRGRCP